MPKYAPSRPQKGKEPGTLLGDEICDKNMIKLDIFQLIIIVFRIFLGLKLVSRTAPNDSVLPRPRCTNQPLGIPSIPVWKTSGNRSPGSADNRPPRVTHKRGLLVYLTVTAMIRSIRLLFVRFCRYITRYTFKIHLKYMYVLYAGGIFTSMAMATLRSNGFFKTSTKGGRPWPHSAATSPTFQWAALLG